MTARGMVAGLPERRRVIVLVDFPLTPHDVQKFGIPVLRTHGFPVIVWDVSAITHGGGPAPCVREEECRQFPDRDTAISALRRLPPQTVVISIVPLRVAALPIYQALARARVPYVWVCNNAVPLASRSPGIRHRLYRLARTASPRRFLDALCSRVPFHWTGIDPPAAIVAGGTRSLSMPRNTRSSRTKIIWAHSIDYDIAVRQTRGVPDSEPDDAGVFLDEYYPLHPDHAYLGRRPTVDPNAYYRGLRRFFELVEHERGTRVVVAAHPRSRYDTPEYFAHRQVVSGNTAELVRRASFVIAHNSTALNYAVIFRKPVIFITSDSFARDALKRGQIMAASRALGKAPLNADRVQAIDWERELVVDQDLYTEYQCAYIKTSGSPELPCWDIVSHYLDQLTAGR